MARSAKAPTTRRYTAQDKRDAIQLAKELGPAEAARRLSIPTGTLTCWGHKDRVASSKGDEWPPV